MLARYIALVPVFAVLGLASPHRSGSTSVPLLRNSRRHLEARDDDHNDMIQRIKFTGDFDEVEDMWETLCGRSHDGEYYFKKVKNHSNLADAYCYVESDDEPDDDITNVIMDECDVTKAD
ncbi:hypothetical protein IAT40_001712 [Kwoniella sp. CBS 6097]